MPSPYDTYTSPLATRNAGPEMLRLWSARHKFNTWRRVWLAVAEAMHEETRDDASPLVTREQVEELRAVVERPPHGITDEEIRKAEEYERELRHDVMAHVHALGDSCPKARPIIHLGMTSQDVVCNADLAIAEEASWLIEEKIVRVVLSLSGAAATWRSVPCLALTHYQPAQPTTVGRRLAQYADELLLCRSRMTEPIDRPSFRRRGFRGATGTQASFAALFDGDANRADAFEQNALLLLAGNGGIDATLPDAARGSIARSLASTRTFRLTGQTYPRVVDCFILSDLAATASVLHKIATDIRLLSNRKEIDEPFEDKQVGSSAMPYKRNPMRCERICGLTRFVMNLVGNAYDTAATQWLERTLDDSSNRRLSLPEAFLALDGALDLMHNVASGLIVHEAMVRRNLMAELPFLATENILMACVRLGGDRQDYHERIRVHAQAAGMRVKQQGLDNDLLDRLRADPAFRGKSRGGMLDGEIDWDGLMDPMKHVGRSVEQTERFIREVVEPLQEQYGEAIARLGESEPRV